MVVRKKLWTQQQLERELERIGGEPLERSGFEDQTPDEDFSDVVVLPATGLPWPTKASH